MVGYKIYASFRSKSSSPEFILLTYKERYVWFSGTHKSKSALSRYKMKTEDPERYRIYLDKQKVTAKQKPEELKRELQKKKGNEQSKAKKAHQNEMQRR